MTTRTRRVGYRHEGVDLQGVLTFDDGATVSRPAVLVFHGIEGRSDAQVDFAKTITDLGWAGFAVDLFGETGAERGQVQMAAFMQDRARLRGRLRHVLDVVRALPEVDADRVAAAGFCFGGLCALDLARSGADVRGVASFHGVLTPPGGEAVGPIVAKVIVFHGWDDPYAPPEDVVALGRELTAADVDWQIHAYGKTMHAFMAPGADDPGAGIRYNEVSARRAQASLGPFLAEAFA